MAVTRWSGRGARGLNPGATGSDLTLSGQLAALLAALGTNPASAGIVRVPNNQGFKARNAANSADLDLIGTNSSNALLLGSGLTGVLKAVASVITAATLVNADVDAAAAIAMTKVQPYEFLAYAGSVASNVTGNSVNHTVQFGTVVKNESSQYNSATGVFTAPVTGTYFLRALVAANDITSAMTSGLIRIVTSNRTYLKFINPAAMRDVGNTASFEISVQADMDASDTASVTFQVDSGALAVDISGTTDGRTSFGGHFIG